MPSEAINIDSSRPQAEVHSFVNEEPMSIVDSDHLLGTSSASKCSITVLSPKSFIDPTEAAGYMSNGSKKLTTSVDIDTLPGEKVYQRQDGIHRGEAIFTNYRVILKLSDRTGIAVIPNLAIELVELSRDLSGVMVTCRNGRLFRFAANSTSEALAIRDKLVMIATSSRTPNDFHAFHVPQNDSTPAWLKGDPAIGLPDEKLRKEFERLEFPEYWRISEANSGFAMTATYPEKLIVPSSVTDDSLKKAVLGRFLERIPTAVWRDVKSGAVLLRSSQPVIPWIGNWNINQDEVRLFDACRRSTGENSEIIIMDARSQTSAHANRVKGGGFESPTVYAGCRVEFMNLPNIHSVRDSFAQFRQVLSSKDLDHFYFQNVHQSSWLYQVYNIIISAKQCFEYVVEGGKNVLVHCSDGWDRTTQIVSLAKLLGDPYYRTMEGFEVLVRSDWIGFGHKFNDRNSTFNSPSTEAERSPIFLQWLDCVFQLCVHNPTAFVKIAQHCYSGLFGTFLFNSLKEHRDCLEDAKTSILPSLWTYFNHYVDRFNNLYYDSNPNKSGLKIPAMRHMKVWEAVYVPNRFEEPLNSAKDGVIANFSDLAHLKFVESFYPDASSPPMNRCHSEESVSGSSYKISTSSGPVSLFPETNPPKIRRSASQTDTVSISSSVAGPVEAIDYSQPSEDVPTVSTNYSSLDTAADSGGESSDHERGGSASESEQSDPEASSSGSSRSSVVRKFRLRFGKEQVVDADGLTSIINIDVESVQRMKNSYEQTISDLEQKLRDLQAQLCSQSLAQNPSSDQGSDDKGNEEQASTKSDDDFEHVDKNSLQEDSENVERFDSCEPTTIDGTCGDGGRVLHGPQHPPATQQSQLLPPQQLQQPIVPRRVGRYPSSGSNRSSISSYGAFATSPTDSVEMYHFDGLDHSDEMTSTIVPMSLNPSGGATTLRRRQASTSSTASFNNHLSNISPASSGQTVNC
ncbi:hypothetical protein L596_025578 [Steinernema carpocapsae]|uniref:Myotubularin phosphatase domain-containing protein n=2 Tax=Steinernema carpocapsae TaxID=34508 RepID=A0A4V5ZYV0_STECR|nr:hypothetical protein L596_025578 [Steinernema carpocapsae]